VSAAAEDAAPASPSPAPTGCKLRRLEIEKLKAIDRLELDLPGPLMEGDPDVFVIGSANGVGKTSVLEACALLKIAFAFGSLFDHYTKSDPYSLRPYLIKVGTTQLTNRGIFSPGPSDHFLRGASARGRALRGALRPV
jgi:hypothetical protein